jgi:hypothetical protein
MAECSPIVLTSISCPVCAGTMTLANTVKRFYTLPELRTYECRRCAVLTTRREAPLTDELADGSGLLWIPAIPDRT